MLSAGTLSPLVLFNKSSTILVPSNGCYNDELNIEKRVCIIGEVPVVGRSKVHDYDEASVFYGTIIIQSFRNNQARAKILSDLGIRIYGTYTQLPI